MLNRLHKIEIPDVNKYRNIYREKIHKNNLKNVMSFKMDILPLKVHFNSCKELTFTLWLWIMWRRVKKKTEVIMKDRSLSVFLSYF